MSCYIFTVLSAFLADDGTVIIKSNITAQQKSEMVRQLCGAAGNGQFRRKVRYGKRSFVIDAKMCTSFLVPVTACAEQGRMGEISDGDFIKHVISHARIMVL